MNKRTLLSVVGALAWVLLVALLNGLGMLGAPAREGIEFLMAALPGALLTYVALIFLLKRLGIGS